MPAVVHLKKGTRLVRIELDRRGWEPGRGLQEGLGRGLVADHVCHRSRADGAVMNRLHLVAPCQGREPRGEVEEDELGFEFVEQLLDGRLREVHGAPQEAVEMEWDVGGGLGAVRQALEMGDGEREEGYEMRVEIELL